MSIFLSLACILKTKPNHQIQKWDLLFFLSSWQLFNLKIWQNYLSGQTADPYRIAATLCTALTVLYLLRRGIKISIELSARAAKEWIIWTAALAVILIPIGLLNDFLQWNPRFELKFLKNTVLDYFVFVAIIEELVFRGCIFQLLRRVCDEFVALAISTVLFACIYSHLSGGGAFPNWHYAGMALIAGTAYGVSYMRTRNLLVPILIHGTVDSVWRIFFS